jgi:uncharacterized protein
MNEFAPNRFEIFARSPAFEVLCETVDVSRPFLRVFMTHGSLVARMALGAAARLDRHDPDYQLVFEGSLIHDIGSYLTFAPGIDCFGSRSYLWHGVLGAELMRAHSLERHARICERHIGAGITRDDIREKRLGLPPCDYLPESLEEELVCWADKFYSKSAGRVGARNPLERIVKGLERHSPEHAARFLEWHRRFAPENQPGTPAQDGFPEPRKETGLGGNGVSYA